MRIVREDGTPVGPTWAVLTRAEAYELAEALIFYFDEVEEGRPDPGWHAHVGARDQELTIAIEAET